MRIMQPRIGFLVASAVLLATGLSSMAFAAQSQTSEPECYGTCVSGHPWLTQSRTLISFGSEQFQVFHITVGPADAGLEPTGTVAVESGSTTLCTIVLTARGGSCSPSPSALPPGFHSVHGFYSGDANFSAGMSNAETFQVSRFGSGD
jgi:hypothetical protein